MQATEPPIQSALKILCPTVKLPGREARAEIKNLLSYGQLYLNFTVTVLSDVNAQNFRTKTERLIQA
jgi:hypothetical protein